MTITNDTRDTRPMHAASAFTGRRWVLMAELSCLPGGVRRLRAWGDWVFLVLCYCVYLRCNWLMLDLITFVYSCVRLALQQKCSLVCRGEVADMVAGRVSLC